jgi:alpha-L-rhamnosidase
VSPAGRITNESQTAYALAICFDILESDQLRRAGERLAQLVREAGFCVATGFAGTPFVAHALTLTGHLEVAYKLMLNEECPSFLYPLTHGATTTWERWDAIQPDGSLNSTGMTSLNHYALGAVADWLHKVVGGLAPAEPGYRSLLIAPRPGGGLRHARAVKDTPQGRVSVSWLDAGGTRSIEVEIPDGVTAKVVLPDDPEARVENMGAGTHRWSYQPLPVQEIGPDLYTPLKALKLMPQWGDVVAVFHRHIPEMAKAGDRLDLAAFGSNLHELLAVSPLADTLRPDLLEALGHPAQ